MKTLGVDEHIWLSSRLSQSRPSGDGMVDLTRDEHGRLHARLLDVVPGRSGMVYAGWLREQTQEFLDAVEHAAFHPFRGYGNMRSSPLHSTPAFRCATSKKPPHTQTHGPTMRYDRARVSLDRHATYIVAAYLAGVAR